jgi:hypothetical protein
MRQELRSHSDLVSAAQEFVDGWRRDSGRKSFRKELDRAEAHLRRVMVLSEEQAIAFRALASAIRIGYGHAVTNPKPLRELIRKTMRQ